VEVEYLSLDMRLYVALEVVSQLDKAEDSRWLSPEELSLYDFESLLMSPRGGEYMILKFNKTCSGIRIAKTG
jgi:hypothetical protein